MALTKTQQELIGTFGAIEIEKKPFWSTFTEAKTPYLALSDTIKVDEIMAGMMKAGIIPRGATIPAIKVNGHNRVTITPYIIAGSVGISALDTLNAEAGEVVILNGREMKAKDYDRIQKVTEIKGSIENTKEDIAARVFITGKTKDLNDNDVDLGFVAEESKTKGTSSWTIILTQLVADYYSKTKRYPDKIMVGAKVADDIIKEINAAKTPQFTSKVNIADGGIRIELGGFALPIVTYPANDIGENTDTKVTLYKNVCLIPVYAGLEYVGTDGKPSMIRSEVVLDKTEANKETGQAKMFGKSAPFPLVILPELFRRYNFTDLS